MRVIFMGFQTWGTAAFQALLKSRHEISLVITHCESKHEYETIWNDSVKQLALMHKIPVIECQYANNKEVCQAVAEVVPDIIVMSDWRTWLSPNIYSIPRYGAVNIHDALLPKYGGFAPINWAIINGENEVGVTIHFASQEFDLGDIILQHKIPVAFSETATDVFYKVIEVIPRLTLEALDLIEYNKVIPVPQDGGQATFYHKRSIRDGLICWNKSRTDVYNLIRAQSDPYPNAYTIYQGRKLNIKQAVLSKKCYRGTPGRIFCRAEDGVVVVCGENRLDFAKGQGLVIRLVQEEGKKEAMATDYFDRMGDYLDN